MRKAASIVLALAALSVVTPRAASAAPLDQLRDGDGNLWLGGCVEDRIAVRLLGHAGFTNTGPFPVLCIEGYTFVAKQLRD